MQPSDIDDCYKPEIRCVQCRFKKPFRKQSYEYNDLRKQFEGIRLHDDDSEIIPPIKKVKSNELDQQHTKKVDQPTISDFQCPEQEFMQQEVNDNQAQLYFLNEDQEDQPSD